MSFMSILFNDPSDRIQVQKAVQPPVFVDLNLDQIIEAITINWKEYDLNQYFYFPLGSIDAIHYRQEVFRDLENPALFQSIKFFTEQMRDVRAHILIKEKLYYHYQKETWFLYAADIYCKAIVRLKADLSSEKLKSRGLAAFQEFITGYSDGDQFIALTEEINSLKTQLAKVKYQIIIRANSFTVQNFEAAPDYTAEIEKTFGKFQQGSVKNYLVKYDSSSKEMNHIEAKILDFIALLNPDLFSGLDNFCIKHVDFIDEIISQFDREIHFYIAYLEHISKFKTDNLYFCYPRLVGASTEVFNREGFDLALAQKLTGGKAPVICNDFCLNEHERIIVVTGPNQGGKTTFARTFGQLHYLASIGCLVPGREAQLILFDQIFTQFERAEKVENLRGKLEDDLVRIHTIIENATSRSVIIMNEIFNSTTLQDVKFLSTQVMEKIQELNLLCVWVTFLDELASFSSQTVSMTSMIVPENPALRTFKIVRRQADGLAYALAIAEKYKLTYNHIKERIRS